jgi:hypothetical protein
VDIKTRVSIVCTHSQYVRKLATDLTTTLSDLEQVLTERNDNPPPTASGYDERLAEVQRLLTQEVEVLRQRLKALGEPSATNETE